MAEGVLMPGALEELARSADEAARDQQRIARQARRLDQARMGGLPWSAVLDGDERPGLVEPTREIGRRLGVSHQRISVWVRRGSP